MPEPHEPQAEESEEFRPSTPDLTPNLAIEGSDRGRVYPDGTPIPIDNDLGGRIEADRQVSHIDRFDMPRLEADLDEIAKIEALKTEIVETQASLENIIDHLRDQVAYDEEEAIETTMAILRRLAAGKAIKHRDTQQIMDRYTIEEDIRRTRKYFAQKEGHANKQFRDNEEAYKNHAINEARHHGIEINYPPYTDPRPPAAEPTGFEDIPLPPTHPEA
ncbi:MAG: hypothetical protein WCO19_03450 [Candidatus Saccharibacteria bacterium]